MKDLIIVATIAAKPGKEALVRAALERVVPPSRAEAGCLRYDLHGDLADSARFTMLEAWRDAEALAQHEATPHFNELVQALGPHADIHVAKLNQLL